MTDTTQAEEGTSLWDRVRRRKVVQWTLAYAAGAWALLQVLGFAAHSFGWPALLKQLAMLGLGVGLPVVATLAWYHGERSQQRVSGQEVAVLSILLVVGGGVLWWYAKRVAEMQPAVSTIAAIESVAVLPFVNASGDAGLDYVSDGLTESLINALARLPGLSVKARSLVFRYKGKEIDPQEVASALSVQSVVSGRMEQHGDRLMFSLGLVNGRNGDQIWGERYDSTITDLVGLQTEIARDLARKLQVHLSGADEQKVTKAYTSSGEAYQLYLQGRYHVQKVALPEIQTGIHYLEQATAIDPDYALAYVGLADAYRTSSAGDIAAELVVPKAIEAAEKAVQIDDSLATAHAQLGVLAIWYDWDPLAAERHFKRALQLDPKNADAHIYYAHLLSNQGRHEEALKEAVRARELEPFNPRISALEAQFLMHAGHTDEALTRLQATLGIDPNHLLAHVFAAGAYIEKRMYPEAIAEATKATEITHRTMSHPLGLLGCALAKSGKEAEARAVLAELLTASQSRYVSPYSVALIYNALGERDEALAWLERGFEARDHKMNLLKVDQKWSNLYGDPRFEDLVRRIGF